MKKRLSSLLLAVLCAVMLAVPAMAYARVDVAKDTSLTIHYADGDNIPVGMEVKVYKVLDMSDAVRFTPATDFENCPMDLTNEANWAVLAENLVTYIGQNQIAPAASGTVRAEDGLVDFGEGVGTALPLGVGVYLIAPKSFTSGRDVYTASPSLLTLPLLDTENDTWKYDAEVAGKVAYSRKSNPGGSTITLGVRKEWKDSGAEEQRPESVSVTLYKDGEPYDTVTLSEANNWQKSWNRLDKNAEWSLLENDVPEGYTALVTRKGNAFLVTNTADVEIPDGEPPLDPGIDIPDEDIPLGPLPQTGIPWLPVQILTTVGVLLFAAGFVVLRRGRRETDEG